MKCRFCGTSLEHLFIDLGSAPPSNAYLDPETLLAPEKHFPLQVMVCDSCWLVQTSDFTNAEDLFTETYGYFSSMSDSWLAHSRRFVETVVDQFALGPNSMVVEVAANDGYLLQYVKERAIPCYGVEPTQNTAAAARQKGIDIVGEFFGEALGAKLKADGRGADLTVANNVLAHVPDINDFVAGFYKLLNDDGVASFEFPHLLRLVDGIQFDTIYHEHFSYLSLTAVDAIFRARGLTVFDVVELPTHGGSLRVFAQRSDTGRRPASERVAAMIEREQAAGVKSLDYYASMQKLAERVKDDFVEYLISAKRKGLSVAAYGAAAKGNTLLNFAGIRPDLIGFVVDRSPGKQGRFMPGSRIPIVAEEELRRKKPDRVVILPWNLRNEIKAQLSYIGEWGGKFVIAIPALEEFDA